MSAVPKLRFPEFDGDWHVCDLLEISNVFDGTHQTPNYTDRGVPFVSVENIGDLLATNKYISCNDFEKEFKNKPRKGDVFMTRITAGVIGATAVLREDIPLGYYVSLAMIRPNQNINSDFLAYNINTTKFKRELHKRVIHVAFPKKINLGDIGKCLVSYTSSEEQQKIAVFLSFVDDKIDLLRRQKSELELHKRGLMQRIFSQEVRFKADDGSDFPGWKQVNVSHMISPAATQKVENPTAFQLLTVKLHRKGVVASGNFPKGSEKGRPYYMRRAGEIIIGRQNLHNGGIGIVGSDCDGLIASNAISSFDVVQGNVPQFVLESLSTRKFLFDVSNNSGGTGQQEISERILVKMPIEVPCLEEQQKIASFLSAIDLKIQKTSSQIEEMETFKKGLLQQMFV